MRIVAALLGLISTLVAWPLAAADRLDATPRIAVMSAFGPEMTVLKAGLAEAKSYNINGVEFATGTFAGRQVVMFLILGRLMIPGLVNLVPTYILMAKLGLLDSYQGLILIYWVHSLPLAPRDLASLAVTLDPLRSRICVVPMDQAWRWSEEMGDPRDAALNAMRFANTLGLGASPTAAIRVRGIIVDHLGDLLSMPPMPDDMREKVVLGEAKVTARESGTVVRHEEIIERA